MFRVSGCFAGVDSSHFIVPAVHADVGTLARVVDHVRVNIDADAFEAAHQALEAVLDPIILAGLRQLRVPGQPDPLVPIIDLYLQEAPSQLAALEKAIARDQGQ